MAQPWKGTTLNVNQVTQSFKLPTNDLTPSIDITTNNMQIIDKFLCDLALLIITDVIMDQFFVVWHLLIIFGCDDDDADLESYSASKIHAETRASVSVSKVYCSSFTCMQNNITTNFLSFFGFFVFIYTSS